MCLAQRLGGSIYIVLVHKVHSFWGRISVLGYDHLNCKFDYHIFILAVLVYIQVIISEISLNLAQ